MLFCDLAIDGATVWSGVPCLNGVDLSTGKHLGFSGDLVFLDTMGSLDPYYSELDGRFALLYFPAAGSPASRVPLQPLPSQQLSIILGGQNCVLSVYEKDVSGSQVSGDYLSLTAPLTMAITDVGTATAHGGSGWLWTVTNGAVLSGQGTSSITFQPTSGGTVTVTVTASLVTGGVATATAEVLAYNPGAFSVSAPEYVWAGQFGVPVSALGGDAPLNWSVSGTGIKLVGSSTLPSTSVDIGQSGLGAAVTLSVGGAAVSTWTFKVVPYTSTASYTTGALTPGAYEDFVMPLGWQYQILSLQTDNPACVRVYQTSASRAADAGRSLVLDPAVSLGDPSVIVLEVTTVVGHLSFSPLSYQPTGTNGDTPRSKSAYCRIYNTGPSTVPVTLILTRTELRTSGVF